ncbi:MAG TPA: hypothetical protein DD435_02520 [Cyanobacteria bacterium UBA8530]|nr:hypothetical protein [Cyanobacteria bacterium UBA8530]
MAEQPKTRFEIVSKGVGMLSGSAFCLLLGGILFLAGVSQYALTIALMGCAFLVVGLFQIFGGLNLRTKSFKCPTCQTQNEVLAGVSEFPCKDCGKPIFLRPKKK